MKKILLIISIVLFIVKISFPQQIHGEVLADTGKLMVARVWGTHYERGVAYAYLCKNKIMSVWNNYIVPSYGILLPYAESLVGNPAKFNVKQKYIDEAQGMIHGLSMAGVDTTSFSYLDIFVVNFATDLQGLTLFKGLESQHCSSLMDWGDATTGTDLDGRSVITHHLDGYTDTAITHNQVMVVHLPSETDEQPWLLTGTAGQMVASQSVNNSGISAFLDTEESFTSVSGIAYEPVTLAIRNGIELKDFNNDGCCNINDVRGALDANTQGYADGFIVCALGPSTAGNDSLIALVAELAPLQPEITFRYNNYSDTIPGDNLYAANSFIKRNNVHSYCSRYLNVSNELISTFNGQNIGTPDNWNIMKDFSHQSTNLQTIQVIPEKRKLKISVRDVDIACNYTPVEYNFDDLFQVTGINEMEMNDNFISVYPNPVSDQLTINLKNTDGPFYFEIADIRGQILYSLATGISANIDMSAFSSGIYLIRVISEKSMSLQKILKL